MTQIYLGDSPMVEARNPWASVGMAKSPTYRRQPAPWDKRKGGYQALRPAQREWIEGQFTSRARATAVGGAIYNECQREGVSPGTMQMNACRVKKLAQQLRQAPEPKPYPEGSGKVPGRPSYQGRVPRMRQPYQPMYAPSAPQY